MRTRNRYKFTLTASLLDEIIFSQQVYPQFSDLNMKYTKEADQVYYTPSFDSKLSFVDEEFDLIVGQDLRVKFSLSMQDTYHIFSTKQMSFMRTDCEIDVNHKLVTVTPKLFNPYKKLIDKRDEEYSVVDMDLYTKTLNFYLNTQLQVYAQEDNVINLIGLYGKGIQHIVTPQHNHYALTRGEYDNTNDARNPVTGPGMNFSGYPIIAAVLVGTGDDPRFVGTFTAIANVGDFMQANIDGRVVYYYNGPVLQSAYRGNYVLMNRAGGNAEVTFGLAGPYMRTGNFESFYLDTNQVSIVRTEEGETIGVKVSQGNVHINDAYSLTSGSFQTDIGTVNFTCRIYVLYTGLVTGRKVSTPLGPFPTGDDVVDITAEFNQNYKTRYPCGNNALYTPNLVSQRFVFSHRTSSTPTPYGKVANTDLYYNTPDDTNVYLPIKKDSWFGGHSFWLLIRNSVLDYYLVVYNNVGFYTTENQYPALRIQKSVTDFYSLYDVIHGMLQKIAPEIVFLHDTTHSQFLFSQINPVTEDSQLEKYMTQKSNVLKLDYDYPAWKAPLKWSQLEELLKNAFNCYTELFYDESDNSWHLRIEHIKYFINGHTYEVLEGNTAVVDLTQARDGFNMELLSFRTNRWKYDTESQANRYEFGWMDTQTEVFDGKPLIVTQEYNLYEDNKKEELNISWFDTDIDFAMSVTSEISSDGFMLVSAQSDGFIEFVNASTQVNNPGMQNYSLSFDYLIPAFHLCDKYAEYMQIEGTDTLLAITPRKKMRIAEDIQFKVPENVEIQPSNLVKTEAGFAEIDSITIDMTDNSCTATLRYETL